MATHRRVYRRLPALQPLRGDPMNAARENHAEAEVCDAAARSLIPGFRDGEGYVIVALASGRGSVCFGTSLDDREVADLLITVAAKLRAAAS